MGDRVGGASIVHKANMESISLLQLRAEHIFFKRQGLFFRHRNNNNTLLKQNSPLQLCRYKNKMLLNEHIGKSYSRCSMLDRVCLDLNSRSSCDFTHTLGSL